MREREKEREPSLSKGRSSPDRDILEVKATWSPSAASVQDVGTHQYAPIYANIR